MIKHSLALLFALFLLQAPVAHAQSANLTGDWHGVYTYIDGDRRGQDTPFEFDLVQNGSRISGTTLEPNTFGTADARFLLATVQGSVSQTQITFDKTYDGTGGQTHTVHYTGTIMPGGRRITGTWRIADGTQGPFEMVR